MNFFPASAVLAFGFVLMAQSSSVPAQTSVSVSHRAQVMVVGTYHFVSKKNVYSLAVDDPMSRKRQNEIADLVSHLARFHPTEIVLEQSAGTSDLEEHYEEYKSGRFTLPASENYQIGFRLARRLNHSRIFTINAWTDFNYEGVMGFAEKHGQMGLVDKAKALAETQMQHALVIQNTGTVLGLYRYFNSQVEINRSNACYMYLARVGDAENFVGADLVGQWHMRNLRMFAKLTRLVDSPRERILVLYGQGHEYLLRDFIRQSPDLRLIDAEKFLR